MQYANLFQPKLKSFDIEDDGEQATFFYRPPRAAEVMDGAEQNDGKKPTRKEINVTGIKQWIVHQDGSALADAEADAIMAMSITAFAKFSDKLSDVMGLKKDAAAGEQKNA